MKDETKLKETIVPVVAPLRHDLELDQDAVARIFSYLYANDAIPFILGTTGESASLSNAFKEEYLRAAVANKPHDRKLYVGISSNILQDSVSFANLAASLGVEEVAATLPTYYKLSEVQMEKYFLELAEAIETNLIVYNIPATTHMSIPLEMLDRLSYHPKIVAVKDSERSMERLDRSLALWKDRTDFKHYMGWAGACVYSLLNGSDGIIPSSGNFAPAVYADMCRAVEQGDVARAEKLQEQSDRLGTLYQANKSLGESLWALKVLMKQLGLCEPYMMPPLYALGTQEENKLIEEFQALIVNENIKLNIVNHV
ncbi:dihydrodipicolinate synthase family protein [Sphingobacterium sp. LRF_L2]|uniref:dihydrodipicolinate synthase family protein n=1 Tax=Sphingobacterium sp. LRF_L2 TaxID=3369421 RepID=UPI003F5FC798